MSSQKDYYKLVAPVEDFCQNPQCPHGLHVEIPKKDPPTLEIDTYLFGNPPLTHAVRVRVGDRFLCQQCASAEDSTPVVVNDKS